MKEIRQRYYDKAYANAPIISCACGCGESMKSKNRYGRKVRFINGHNTLQKYDDPTQYKREWNHRNRKSKQLWQHNYYRQRKVKLIVLLGGKCTQCGIPYNGKNACIFQCHHRDPKAKEHLLNVGKLWIAWAKILEEVKKCDLVCANCHFMIHCREF